MSTQPMPVYTVAVMLMNGDKLEQDIAASSIFGAVKFIQDEAVKNGWKPAAILAELKSFDDKTIDMLEGLPQ